MLKVLVWIFVFIVFIGIMAFAIMEHDKYIWLMAFVFLGLAYHFLEKRNVGNIGKASGKKISDVRFKITASAMAILSILGGCMGGYLVIWGLLRNDTKLSWKGGGLRIGCVYILVLINNENKKRKR